MRFQALVILFCMIVMNTVNAQPANDTRQRFREVHRFRLIEAKNGSPASIRPENKSLTLLVFLSPECPLCQNYTKTIREISNEFPNRLNVYGIFPGNAYTTDDITAFAKTYGVNFPLFIDEQQMLTRYLKATVTPEAILLDSSSMLIYKGAIDDWAHSLGKTRLHPMNFYTRDAIMQSLSLLPVKIKETAAIGCKINDH